MHEPAPDPVAGVPEFTTARLRLRGWRDDDVEAWADLNADPRVMEFFPSTARRTESVASAARLRAALARDGFGWWAIEVRGGLPFAGVVALQKVPSLAHLEGAMEIGWRLAAAAWGNGYAPEAATALLAFAFETLRRDEIVAFTARTNRRSRRVMEKIGMTYDPRDDFEHPRIAARHPLRPHVLYRIGAETWRRSRDGGAAN